MPKNVVVCCDGTANEFARDRTNVIKLFYTLIHDPSRQVAFYHPGLGTMEAAGALTTFSRRLTKLAGLAIGYGLEADVRDAYVFLMNYFQEGDRLFLFGFSRGAYTARAVASLLHMYGLIRKGDEPLVPYAIRMLMAINRAQGRTKANQPSQVSALFKLADEFKAHFSGAPCKPYFVGVWDTADMHESLTPVWWGAEFIPKRHYNWDQRKEERRMNLFRRRTIPDGSMIHDAAYQRGADYEKLLPANAVRVS
jgi:uncharacterized protein (DUF2235 family)